MVNRLAKQPLVQSSVESVAIAVVIALVPMVMGVMGAVPQPMDSRVIRLIHPIALILPCGFLLLSSLPCFQCSLLAHDRLLP